MTLIHLLIAVLVIGAILYAINILFPEPFKKVAYVVLFVIFIIWLIRFSGLSI